MHKETVWPKQVKLKGVDVTVAWWFSMVYPRETLTCVWTTDSEIRERLNIAQREQKAWQHCTCPLCQKRVAQLW